MERGTYRYTVEIEVKANTREKADNAIHTMMRSADWYKVHFDHLEEGTY